MLSFRRAPARGWGPELAREREERAGEEGSPGARPPPARAGPRSSGFQEHPSHAGPSRGA